MKRSELICKYNSSVHGSRNDLVRVRKIKQRWLLEYDKHTMEPPKSQPPLMGKILVSVNIEQNQKLNKRT